jgi:hypothetical protein
LIVEIYICHKPLLKAREFLLLLLLLRQDDEAIAEYRGVYGGGVDERVDRRGETGGSFVSP